MAECKSTARKLSGADLVELNELLAGLSREQLCALLASLQHVRRLRALRKINPGDRSAEADLAAFKEAAEQGYLLIAPVLH